MSNNFLTDKIAIIVIIKLNGQWIKNMKKYHINISHILSILIIILTFIASASGLFIDGTYSETTWATAQLRGMDLITLFLVLPVFTISLYYSINGSSRATLVWLGALSHILYTYMTGAFQVGFNYLFLAYISILSLSVYTMAYALLHIDAKAIKNSFTKKTPILLVSGFLFILASAVMIMWLSQIITAYDTGTLPETILLSGNRTNSIYVADLSFVIPIMFISAYLLWKKKRWGYVLSGIMLIKGTTLGMSLLAMTYFLHKNSITSPSELSASWIVLTVLGILVSSLYFLNMKWKQI